MVQTAVAAHSLGQAGQVGKYTANNFDLGGMLPTLLGDGEPKGICRLLAALDALADVLLLELPPTLVSRPGADPRGSCGGGRPSYQQTVAIYEDDYI